MKNCIYNSVREAITNGLKHGNARQFLIDITKRGEMIQVIVEDNGVGCSQIKKSHGLQGIEAACEGTMLLHSEVSSRISKLLHSIEHTAFDEKRTQVQLKNILTPREIEVVELIMQGKSNKQIGSALFLTEGTVKNYISRILDKLELNNRTELVLHLQNKH